MCQCYPTLPYTMERVLLSNEKYTKRSTCTVANACISISMFRNAREAALL